jgi:cAMP phosphodiesterase
MKIEILGCYGSSTSQHRLTSFLLNDRIALDAGGLANALSLRRQVRIRDVLITHSHLDHTCSLPFLIDNHFDEPGFMLRIYALPEVVASIRRHLFNNRTWPDFTRLPNDDRPALRLIPVRAEQPFAINGLTVRAIRMSHIVPSAGFLLEDRHGAVAYSGDTGPTKRFWEILHSVDRLRAVIVETSFPNERHDLAHISGHLTPAALEGELAKLERDVPIYIYGAKPNHVARIRQQLRALKQPRIKLLVSGRTYRFER